MSAIGKKTSFFEIFKEGNHKIEIPIIQRDYAQGRSSVKEIRLNFLRSIKKSIEKNEPIHLDFVYGSIENGVFIPLDGQQRLTTLFLLHWYLAAKESRLDEFKTVFTHDDESRFTYETRTSSREFCNALISKDIAIPNNEKELLSEVIKDSPWYFISWDNDPTIASMLNMLDAIHKLYFTAGEVYDKLISPEQLISFQFIELRDFGLTDSLYIKMNARGKGLTDFENFKAKYSKILELQDKENGTKLKDVFTINIDTCWTDLFWPYRDKTANIFDNQIMNLIRVIITNYYSLKHASIYDEIRRLIDPKTKFTYYQYEELECFDLETNTRIIDHLNAFLGAENKLNSYLKDSGVINEEELFQKVVSYNLSYPERIQFYGFYQYLVLGKSSEGLFDWMRVVRNLTVNTRIDEIQDYMEALQSINSLLDHSEQILDYLADEKNNISKYASIQVEEERIKAHLLLKEDDWRDKIINMENHNYFNGQIGFLLSFSGVSEYYSDNDGLDWNADENEIFQKQFDSNSKKALAIFDDNGIKYFADFLFERALLATGDYLLNKGYNYSFGINGRERDISWKRLLRDDDEGREILNELFNQVTADNIEDDLQTIIDNAEIDDWREYFIKFPELISVCGKNKFIRWNTDNDILLLEKTQTNGTHREYYSYALAVRLMEMGNDVSYNPEYSVDYPKFINHINKSSVKIYYGWYKPEEDGDYQYYYRIHYKKDKFHYDTQEEVIEKLVELDIIESSK